MGRPALFGERMTPAERQAAARMRKRLLIESARAHIEEALSNMPGVNARVRESLRAALVDLADIR